MKKEKRLHNCQNKVVTMTVKDASGKVLMIPFNARTSFKEEVTGDDISERNNILWKVTKKGNNDVRKIEESIFENGINLGEKSLKIMDIVDALYSVTVKEQLMSYYAEDEKLMELIDDVTSTISSDIADKEEKLAEFRDKYYVLIGGNTRWSIIMSYLDFYQGALDNSELSTKVTFEIVDYSSILSDNFCNRFADNMQQVNGDFFDLLFMLMSYKDNSDYSKRNATVEDAYRAKGLMSRKALEMVAGMNNQADIEDTHIKALWDANFKGIFKNANIGYGDACEGMCYIVIKEALIEYCNLSEKDKKRYPNLYKNINKIGNTTDFKNSFVSFAMKTITTSLSSDKRLLNHFNATLNFFGLGGDLKLENYDSLLKYLDLIGKIYFAKNKKSVPGSVYGSITKNYVLYHVGKNNKILSKDEKIELRKKILLEAGKKDFFAKKELIDWFKEKEKAIKKNGIASIDKDDFYKLKGAFEAMTKEDK